MGKLKVRKSMLKRFKVTSTGKVLRRHQLGAGHLKRKKSKSALERQKKTVIFFPADLRKIRKVLGL